MVLEWVVEIITGLTLDRFLKGEIYSRIGLDLEKAEGLFFTHSEKAPRDKDFAATEFCPWRNQLVIGWVHDENAYVSGGVGGHAGLFGRAIDVHALLTDLLHDYYGVTITRLFNRELLEACFSGGARGERGLGFDTPSPSESSCGRYFSRNSIGHLGFTGTSFWVDLDRHVAVVLMTNRIHPSRGNVKIKGFRPKLHDAVIKAIG
jgi:CubicO group peptidase (beta-lactamase class C family)